MGLYEKSFQRLSREKAEDKHNKVRVYTRDRDYICSGYLEGAEFLKKFAR